MGGYQSDVSGSLRGWRTVGTLDPGGESVPFPAGKAGDVILITGGGAVGVNWGVSPNDILYCKTDNDGNSDDWIVIPHIDPVP